MSERLTERNANGTAKSRKSPKSSYMGTVYEEMAEIQAEILNRLCDLEDKIEQGKIVELPCQIGDEVWINRYFHSKLIPQKGIVSEMKFLPNMELQIVVKYVCRGRWGKDIFATLEEANKSKLH